MRDESKLDMRLFGEMTCYTTPSSCYCREKALSVNKSPSLHLVLATKIRLQKHLSPVGSDCEVIAELRHQLHVQLEQYFTVSDLHIAASLLDTRLKDNTVVLSRELTASRTVREMIIYLVIYPVWTHQDQFP